MKPELVCLTGSLRGNGLKSECEVRVEMFRSWHLNGFENPPVYRKHEIVSWNPELRDGQYELVVHSDTFAMLLSNGRWTQTLVKRVS